jgi:hypothetical protein
MSARTGPARRRDVRGENRRTALALIGVMIALVLISIAIIIVKHHH